MPSMTFQTKGSPLGLLTPADFSAQTGLETTQLLNEGYVTSQNVISWGVLCTLFDFEGLLGEYRDHKDAWDNGSSHM